jgi:ABC-type transporter Mla subunit MlaD
MRESLRNSLIGLFVIGGLCVLGGLMVLFGETPDWLIHNEWELVIRTPGEVRGIGDGTPVYLNGVEIGRVNRLEFQDIDHPGIGVQVVAKIKSKYSVPKGAVAKMYGATLGLGSGSIHIIVQPTTRIELLPKEKAYIRGEMASVFGEIVTEDMTNSVQRAVNNIADFAGEGVPVARNLAGLLERRTVYEVEQPGAMERGTTANVATVVERIDLFVKHLNEVLGDANVQEDVKAIVSGLNEAVREAQDLVELWKRETKTIAENANEGIERTETNLNEALVKLIDVVENLDDSTKELNSILQGVAAGEGTAGLLVRDERLYESGVLALQRLADVLASIRRITGKIERDGYITVGQTTAVGTFTKDFPVGPQPSNAAAGQP